MAQAQRSQSDTGDNYPPFTPQPAQGRNARLGLIALSSDPATEPEWRRMIPDDEIAVYVSRIPYASNCTPEDLRAMAESMTTSAGLIAQELDPHVIAYSCTAGTVNIGYDNVATRIRQAHPEVPVATPITGAVEAFHRFDATKIGVVTPYPNDVNETIDAYLRNEGLEITGFQGFGMTTDHDISTIPIDALTKAAESVITDETEALFFSCTALIIVEHIQMLEDRFSLPVVTSNQAMLWQSLRLAGYKKPIEGFGKLLTV